jgi:NDP-sugar pyrophosphorylase family protein
MTAGPLTGIDVLILAGGLGTRIRSVLGDTPKVLAPVAGRPTAALILDWLTGQGADRVIFALGHRAEAVQDWLAANPRPGCELITVVEPEPLGTAGAIRFARPALRGGLLLVLNGDTLLDADLSPLVRDHGEKGAEATLLCLALTETGRYGRLELDAGGWISRFAEKDPAAGPGLINAGVYLFEPAFLDRLNALQARSIEQDAFARLPAGSLAGSITQCRFIDLGIPSALEEAQTLFASNLYAPDVYAPVDTKGAERA